MLDQCRHRPDVLSAFWHSEICREATNIDLDGYYSTLSRYISRCHRSLVGSLGQQDFEATLRDQFLAQHYGQIRSASQDP